MLTITLRVGRFLTKIFHPNVSSAGEICVNTLKKDWQPTFGIEHILVTVKCLLIYPNPESALDEDAGRALLEDYEQYCMRARTMTSVHAMMKVRILYAWCKKDQRANSPLKDTTRRI
jgi:ubiquitin-conjugating enzyme E2 S